MKQIRTIIGLSILFFFGLTLLSQGQYYGRMGKNRTQNVQKRNFSIEKTRPIEGKVAEVTLGENCLYGSPGIHLTVNDGKENYSVHMGPEYFFKNKGISFKKGDSVKLNTFEGIYNEKVAFFASSLIIGGKVIVVRDKYGDPEWRRSRGGRPGRGRGRRPYRRYNYR